MREKQLNLNSHIYKRYEKKMLFEIKNVLTSRVLLSQEFVKEENSLLEKVEPHKKFNYNWWKITSWELMNYTKEEIETMCPD